MSDNQNFNTEMAAIILFAYFCGCPDITKNESVVANKDMAILLAGALHDIYKETRREEKC